MTYARTVSIYIRVFLAAWVLLMSFTVLRAQPGNSTYQGFTIDESQVRNAPNLDALRAAIREQIDIVCAVGVPAEILKFFQGVPFVLVPAGAIPRGSPGLYGGKDRSVKVVSSIVGVGHKPVLLHELLHAFHDQRLKGGFRNREILDYFERTKGRSAFAAKSHMMQNPAEFFACSATTYLFGVTAQEPFQREKLKEGQPEFFAHLKTLFGAETGNYAGSLTR